MLPFDNIAVDIAIDELKRIVPMNERWLNEETGDEQSERPLVIDGWKLITDWGFQENIFVMCVPITIDLEFPKQPNPYAKALQAFIKNRTGETEHDWSLFKTVIGSKQLDEWWKARENTRYDDMLAPEGLQAGAEADPNAGSVTSEM